MSRHPALLNYSAHALDELNALIPRIKSDMPGIRRAHEAVAGYLHQSVKFLLPNCADVLDLGELRQVHIDMARLPYPVVALEAPWILEDGMGGDKLPGVRSSRRIALCLSMDEAVASAFPDTARFLDEPAGGVVVIPVSWVSAERTWKLPIGAVYVPYNNDVSLYHADEADLPTRLVNEPLREAGVAPGMLRQFRVAPFALLPEWHAWESARRDTARLRADIVHSCRDEVAMLIQTCCVLNCANVQAATVDPPEALNRHRVRAGKQPFFSYRVLELTVRGAADAADGAGGQHASPRAHLRRGHIRRVGDRVIWVRAALVNADSATGRVEKTYQIAPPAAAAAPPSGPSVDADAGCPSSNVPEPAAPEE
ncbi:hypothetical protein [Stenotrophomonas sp. MMGLT7]|uniref:hypothetical protein n=1 Tax=Stenotrophomonas sp. MMGLT7 TaxID=2901227 RepID=UPI001E4069A8|nr:hypothetical protein [Stenotrophomonas sp. MMGLT7]MCD7098296.1 hypothetical protein [Stenotrophomonas sp. MMGLT7]